MESYIMIPNHLSSKMKSGDKISELYHMESDYSAINFDPLHKMCHITIKEQIPPFPFTRITDGLYGKDRWKIIECGEILYRYYTYPIVDESLRRLLESRKDIFTKYLPYESEVSFERLYDGFEIVKISAPKKKKLMGWYQLRFTFQYKGMTFDQSWFQMESDVWVRLEPEFDFKVTHVNFSIKEQEVKS